MNNDWNIISKIIQSDYPFMMKHFKKCMKKKTTIYGNMLIARSDVFNKYCEWLFDVLNKYDSEIINSGKQVGPRVDGYLSEHLLWIWVTYYIKKSERYYLEIKNTEIDSFKDQEYKNSTIGKFIKFIKSHRSLLVVYRFFGYIYLLIKRR